MSQNREMMDRDGVAKGLEQRATGDDFEIARLVAHHAKPSG
jgi:predicted FMN-binding regulatory protein PaiB